MLERDRGGENQPRHAQEPTTSKTRHHTHDASATNIVRGTYATRLVQYGLSDQEVADVLGWSANQVADIRKIYVQDDAAIQALSEKIARMQVADMLRTG